MDIRKISVGPDYKSGAMHYIVGQKVLGESHEIHAIRHNEFKGSFQIWIINEAKEVMLWKEFSKDVPICVEHNINF